MPRDSMVVEYKGAIIRHVMEDSMEKRHKRQRRDCYLFSMETAVVDATGKELFCKICEVPFAVVQLIFSIAVFICLAYTTLSSYSFTTM